MTLEVDTEALYARYQRLQQYVGWTDEDAGRVQRAAKLVEPAFPALVDDFYTEIGRDPEARKVITGGREQVDRLKRTLHGWLIELFSGQYDQEYVSRRWRVGLRHVEIGLDQVYTNVALARLRIGLLDVLEKSGDGHDCSATRVALNKLVDLDLAIIEDAYQSEFIARQQLAQQLRFLQAERLAAIGEMVTGLAHESRNALQRSKTCLEMLALEVEDRPEALDLVGRIHRAQDHLHHLYEEVRSYAAPLILHREPSHLSEIWRDTWSQLELARQEKPVALREEVAEACGFAQVDRFAIGQVFRNIFENAIVACPDPGEIVVRCQASRLDGRPAIEISIRDNGPGLNAEQAQRIFDPFYTTKTKGTGLGMAIARRIVEAHGGRIAVGSQTRPGAEIILALPTGSDVP